MTPMDSFETPQPHLARWEPYWIGLCAGLLLLGCAWIIPHGDFRQLGTVPQFWLGSGIMGLGYVLSWRIQSISARWFWGVAIATRFLLLFMYPGDDIWRYLWEGYLQNLGLSPYHFAPNAAELIPYRTDWWALINHRDVSAIYPPVTQGGFRLLAAISPQVWLFKAAFALADLAICGLLSRRFGRANTLLYAWNPLVLYSFAGGGHYDSWFLLPLVAAWLSFEHGFERSFERGEELGARRPQIHPAVFFAAYLLGISIAVKWISLPMLGFMLWQLLKSQVVKWRLQRSQSQRSQGQWSQGQWSQGQWSQGQWSQGQRNRLRLKRLLLVALCALIPLVLTALPFCQVDACPLIPASSGFVVHGRSAALVPHLVEQWWPISRYHNWLYAFPLGLGVLWLMVRSRHFLQFTEGYFTLLLVLSPVIHAWYFTWLIPFAVASRNLGVRLVSLSTFIYFVLQQRIALGGHWLLTNPERALLWLPLFLGGLWTTVWLTQEQGQQTES